MPVGRAQRQAERRAFPIDDQVPLGACLATVRRIGSGLRAPLGRARRRCRARPGASPGGRRHAAAPAVPDAAPPRPRRHATPPAAASRSCRCSPSPQARPAIGCRCATRRGCPPAPHGPAPGGWPPFGRAGSGGNSGSIAAQRSSATRGAAIHPQRPKPSYLHSSKSAKSPGPERMRPPEREFRPAPSPALPSSLRQPWRNLRFQASSDQLESEFVGRNGVPSAMKVRTGLRPHQTRR